MILLVLILEKDIIPICLYHTFLSCVIHLRIKEKVRSKSPPIFFKGGQSPPIFDTNVAMYMYSVTRLHAIKVHEMYNYQMLPACPLLLTATCTNTCTYGIPIESRYSAFAKPERKQNQRSY